MPYVHVHNPTKGIDLSKPPYHLPPNDGIGERATDYAKGVIIRNGEVRSDIGYVAFPTPGTTATNLLNGSVMLTKQFKKLDGSTHIVTFTTTNAYQYNTSTTAWDCITRGQTIEDCEDAWVASANVTSTADATIKIRGSASSKNVIGASFTTGVAATEAMSSTDFSGELGVHFWIYSTVATSSGDLRLLLDDTASCASPIENLIIPALAANTWTPVYIAYATPASLTAIISVGLRVQVDLGAMTVYLDDIRSVIPFTGDEDNRFSVCQMNDIDIITNGIDHPQKYDGTLATGITLLTTTLGAGDISTPEIAIVMKDHVVLMNNTENGADAPQRVSWTNIGEIDDFTGGTAGYQDLVDDADWIISAVYMSDDTTMIYKENSIVEMVWVGGQTPFRFTTVYTGDGSAGKECVIDVGGDHVVIGNRYFYLFNTSGKVTQIDEKINRSVYESINTVYINRSLVIYEKAQSELQFCIPTSGSVPDEIWTSNSIDAEHPWYRKTRTFSGYGFATTQSTVTIGDLVGTIGDQNLRIGDYLSLSNFTFTILGNTSGQVFKISSSTYNNDGAAVTNEFQTPDFCSPISTYALSNKNTNEGSLSDFFRVMQLHYEAKGDLVTTEYSTDGGLSWNPTQGSATNAVSLDSNYATYQQDFDITTRKIRFRFRNTTASSGFFLRYYGFYYHPRSTRR